MKIIKVLSLICFLTVGALAQRQGARLSGKLTFNNGAPVSEASISLISLDKKNAKFETRTDAGGNYKFENLPAGKYSFKAESYQEKGVWRGQGLVWAAEISIAKNENRILDVDFDKPAKVREEVNVNISTGTTQTIDEVSKTVNIIEAQELRDRADFSLIESLRTIPGFRVSQLGGFGRTANIKTRGLRNQDTAILIDGMRFRDATSITGDASAFLSDFTLTSVSRIEVLRGSGSSLYGTNAVGGVIDFQTPQPQKGFHGALSTAFGGYGLKRFRANVSDGNDKIGFNLGVSRTVYSEGIDGEDDARNTNFQSRIEYNPFSETNISARFFVSDAFVRLNSNPDTIGNLPATGVTDAVPLASDLLKRFENGETISNFGGATFIPDANDADAFQKSQFFDAQIVLNQIINGRLTFQGFYQGLRTSRKNTNGVSGVGFQPFGGDENYIFDGQIHTVGGNFNWTPVSSNQLKFGYEYEWEKFGNDGFFVNAADNFSTRAGQSSNTLYAQDLLSFFNDRLQFSGAFRAQWFSLKTPAFSSANFPNRFTNPASPPASYTGDGSVSYFFERTKTKIRAHVGNGYRVPSLYERFGSFFFFDTFFGLGNPDLKPERSIAFDGGVEQTLFGSRARFSATYFYTKLNDVITYRQTDFIGGAAYFNLKGGISRGAEFSASIKASDSADVFASYTFTNSDQVIYVKTSGLPAPNSFATRAEKSYGVPDRQFTLVATQRFKRAWVNFDFLATSAYLAPIFSSSTFQTYVYRFRGNRRADLTAGYTFPLKGEKMNLRVFGTIENLFDYEYFENGFRTVGRNARVGLSFNF